MLRPNSGKGVDVQRGKNNELEVHDLSRKIKTGEEEWKKIQDSKAERRKRKMIKPMSGGTSSKFSKTVMMMLVVRLMMGHMEDAASSSGATGWEDLPSGGRFHLPSMVKVEGRNISNAMGATKLEGQVEKMYHVMESGRQDRGSTWEG
jgi:hypothetical protein